MAHKPEDLNDGRGGVKVFGIEPYIANAQIGVIVPESAFNPIRSETMTLLIKSEPERRIFLRLAGMGVRGNSRVPRKFHCASSGDATKTAEAFLQAGEARLYDGVIEG